MLTVYLVALAFGGTLLVAAMVTGGGEDDGGEGLDGAWFQSLPFWTHWLSFTGVAGALLTTLGVSPVATAALAIGVGWTVGAGAASAVRRLQARDADAALGPRDLQGAIARVTLPVGPGRAGKVRLELGGRTLERIAETVNDAALEANAEVLVYEVKDNGRVRVTRTS